MSSLSQSGDKLRMLVNPTVPESPALEEVKDDETPESIFQQKKAKSQPNPPTPPNSPVTIETNKKVQFSLEDIVEHDKDIAKKIEEQENRIIEEQASKPKRKKRPVSEKQKEALKRGRAKALENRRRKAEERRKIAEYRKLKREEEMREKENYIVKEKLKKEAIQREIKIKESKGKLDEQEIFSLFEKYEAYKSRKKGNVVEKKVNRQQKTQKKANIPTSEVKEKTVKKVSNDPFSHFFN